MGSTDDVVTVVDVQAQVLAARGRAGDAVELALRAIDGPGDTDMLWLVGDAWEVCGRVLLGAGQPVEGVDALARAADEYGRRGAVSLVKRLRAAAGV